MVKDVDGKFYYIGVTNKLKVIFYDFVFALIKKDFIFFVNIKMSCYWFNKKELLEKAEEKYHTCGGKEKAAKYYQSNKDAIKEKAKNKYKK